ncbi:hypothetical protein MMIC_P1758 [Mariprofundus micogutta]|uniref:Peptidoglycan binding domain protein n=1 Tax=Mariprofundus micogutta TaxID=1921010 RepID=A0A1L8CPH3_9PROT|nr:M15 family metallopeptidase [Mariprofundus micogutta]GAV20784.1 hypothetical protein MMIC_P1758 [Mariprofundus micogutta]
MKDRIKIVQAELNRRGISVGTVDGIIGTKTKTALNSIDGVSTGWPNSRKVIAFIQIMCRDKGIEVGKVDGYWGPQTEFAFDQLKHVIQFGELPSPWRDNENPEKRNPNNWPAESELDQFYGKVGENQVRLQLPYPHRLAWDKRKVIHSFYCHEKVRDSLCRVLTQVLDHYGMDEIKRLRLDLWGGCLNVRKKRGGSSYSTHSWGIALDYDSANNKLKWGRDRASFSSSEYDKWWEFWEAEGWVSLGRTKNYDWMHVQAVIV